MREPLQRAGFTGEPHRPIDMGGCRCQRHDVLRLVPKSARGQNEALLFVRLDLLSDCIVNHSAGHWWRVERLDLIAKWGCGRRPSVGGRQSRRDVRNVCQPTRLLRLFPATSEPPGSHAGMRDDEDRNTPMDERLPVAVKM